MQRMSSLPQLLEPLADAVVVAVDRARSRLADRPSSKPLNHRDAEVAEVSPCPQCLCGCVVFPMSYAYTLMNREVTAAAMLSSNGT